MKMMKRVPPTISIKNYFQSRFVKNNKFALGHVLAEIWQMYNMHSLKRIFLFPDFF